jgi:hypothetical protein
VHAPGGRGLCTLHGPRGGATAAAGFVSVVCIFSFVLVLVSIGVIIIVVVFIVIVVVLDRGSCGPL